MSCTFYDAGHILGSAIAVIRIHENGRYYNIAFTGDIGRFGKPIIKDPTLNFADEHKDIDLLIMESTYGDRIHEPVKDFVGRYLQSGRNCFDSVFCIRAHPGASLYFA
jgi:metallo-beta-lactamase family protein